MAQINFGDVFTNENSNQNVNQVGFFNLQNDGDEAVVRFMVNSIEDLEILTTHDIYLDGKFRQISCVRNPRDPIEKCPLCAKNEKIKQTVFIKMLQYTNSPTGEVEVKPVIWQRNASTYAFKIKGYLDNYGPLSQILCKVIRHGVKGDMKTTYDIIPNLSPMQFPQEKYPIVTEAFDNYKALGRVVLDKSYDEITQYVNTGKFPENQEKQDYNNVSTYNPTVEPYVGNVGSAQVNSSGFSSVEMQRPTRYY